MAIDVRQALRDGFDDIAGVRGGIFLVAFALFSTASLPVHQTLNRDLNEWVAELSPQEVPVPPTPLAQDLSVPALLGALAVIFVGAELLRLVAIRSFASDSPAAIPTDEVTEGLGRTVFVLLVTSLIVQVLVYGGIGAFVIPGLIAAALTVFVRQAVLLDGDGVLDAFRTSISIVTANVIQVLLIMVVLIILSVVIGIPTVFMDPTNVIRPVVGTLLGSIVTVYGIAVITRAYQQDWEEEESDEPIDADGLDEEESLADGA